MQEDGNARRVLRESWLWLAGALAVEVAALLVAFLTDQESVVSSC
jgi:hypothetical protein